MADVRVLVLAGGLLARTGLAALLETQAGLYVVGQSSGGAKLLDDLDVYRPDVAICDLGYQPAASLGNLSALAEARLPVVALIADPGQALMALSMLAGLDAYGLLLADSEAGLLGAALLALADGLVVLDPALAATVIPAEARPLPLGPDAELTPREAEVLRLVARGLSNKAIAQELTISPNTVKFHLNAILSKLDAQSRTEAVVRASQLGLISL
jgi:two-component system, NarL family, nitrate/nitrite response regulator NarL